MLSILLALTSCTSHHKPDFEDLLCGVLQPANSITLADSRVTESSGLASSWLHKDVYYTHNDSGDSARIFAFDRTGKSRATINISGVKAVDIEDMATAKIGGKSTVFVGDIGDNGEKRKDIRIYRFAEPSTLSGEMQVQAEILEIEYPDGPHNAESLLVHPQTGAITIVAKTDKGPSGIYSSGPNPPAGKLKLTKVGQVEISFPMKEGKLITGGSWSPDGKKVALRTYLTAYEFPANDGKWWSAKRRTVAVPLQRQAEAITYTTDGLKILTSSEGTPCVVYETAVSTFFP